MVYNALVHALCSVSVMVNYNCQINLNCIRRFIIFFSVFHVMMASAKLFLHGENERSQRFGRIYCNGLYVLLGRSSARGIGNYADRRYVFIIF